MMFIVKVYSARASALSSFISASAVYGAYNFKVAFIGNTFDGRANSYVWFVGLYLFTHVGSSKCHPLLNSDESGLDSFTFFLIVALVAER